VLPDADSLFRPPQKLGRQIQSELEKIKANATTDADRLLGVLGFVQRDIRYYAIAIGTSSHTPTTPDTVMARRFGDCKDKTLLTISMLRTLGIDAKAALVNSGLRQGILSELPSAGIFDHVIVKAIISGKTYWLDPTSPPQSNRLDSMSQADFGYALVADSNTNELSAMLTASSNTSKKTVNVKLDLTASSEKPVRLKVMTTLDGSLADTFRATLARERLKSIQDSYTRYYAAYYPGVKPAGDIVIDDDKPSNKVSITEQYEVNDFWQRQGNSSRLVATVHIPEVETYLVKPTTLERTAPYAVNHPVNFTQTNEIKLPASWSIKPEKLNITDKAFQYTRSVTNEGRTLVISDSFRSLADHVSASEIRKHRENIDNVRKQLEYTLHWNPESERASFGNLKGIDVSAILASLIALAIGCYAAFFFYRYDPPIKAPPSPQWPTGINGWLLLPTIGVLISPLRCLSDLLKSAPTYETENWRTLTDPAADQFDSLAAPILLIDLGTGVITFILTTLLVVLFFQKRRVVPMLYIVVFGGSLVVYWLTTWLGSFSENSSIASTPQALARMVGMSISFAIWGGYFMWSKRVKATFVRTWKTMPPANDLGANTSEPQTVYAASTSGHTQS
jgi:Protein of unknown function (DUF2569)/Transglutaminase-like superfamily